MTSFRRTILFLILAPSALSAAGISYTGVTSGEWITDTNWSSNTYASSSDHALPGTPIHLSVPHPNNIRAIRIATNGNSTLHIASQDALTYTVLSNDNLEAINWTTIWTGTGTTAGTITIPESLWSSDETHFFLRLSVSN